jgi:L-threonylcarbamoyladenylate synthase
MPTITRDIDAAVERLEAGGLVAIPTETVYGLAADARNAAAVACVFELKRRPANNPLIVHLAEAAWSSEWAAEISEPAARLMSAFWPGPLTLVLTARADVPAAVTAAQDSVALRVPDHPVGRELLRRFGRAVVAPSANRFMSVSPTTADHVLRQFAGVDLLVLDGGACTVGVESTIVSLLPGDLPRLLRPGMIGREAIEAVLGRPLAAGVSRQLRAPGQHERHYAPARPAWRFEDVGRHHREDPRIGWLLCGRTMHVAGTVIDLGPDPAAYARRLYAALYRLDHADIDAICIQLPPRETAWAAVHDRLRRATRELPADASQV